MSKLCTNCPMIAGCHMICVMHPKDIKEAPCGAYIGVSSRPSTFWIIDTKDCIEKEDGVYSDIITFAELMEGEKELCGHYDIKTFIYPEARKVMGRKE